MMFTDTYMHTCTHSHSGTQVCAQKQSYIIDTASQCHTYIQSYTAMLWAGLRMWYLLSGFWAGFCVSGVGESDMCWESGDSVVR